MRLRGGESQSAYHYQPLNEIEFEVVVYPTWAGIQKQRFFAGDNVPVEAPHPLIFPNILFVPVRSGYALHFRTPIDDYHTQIYYLRFRPNTNRTMRAQPEDAPVEFVGTRNDAGEFHMEDFTSQDHMAWETQGPVADRVHEHLGESDRGVILFRKLLRDQIRAVQTNGDPVGINTDPEKDQIISLIQKAAQHFPYSREVDHRKHSN